MLLLMKCYDTLHRTEKQNLWKIGRISIGTINSCVSLLQMGAALVNEAGGGNRHWSAEHDAACQKAARPVPSSRQAPSSSLKKPRVESRASTIVPSFKVRTAHIYTCKYIYSMCGEISLGDIKLGCIDVNVAPEKNIWSLLVSSLRSAVATTKPKTNSTKQAGARNRTTTKQIRNLGLLLMISSPWLWLAGNATRHLL